MTTIFKPYGIKYSIIFIIFISLTAINAKAVAPVLTEPTSTTVPYTEGGGAVQITSTITVSDVDDTELESGLVKISAGFQSETDVLGYTETGSITCSYNSSNGELTLNGTGTLAEYESVLRSITFYNTSDNPSTTTRTISFTVNDGDDDSNTPTRNVSVTAENDAPVLIEPSSATISFTEGGGAVQITSTISITDADDINLTSATVEISSGYQSGEDELAYTSYGGISGSFSSGILSLSGSTSIANYQSVLQSVTFNNTSDNPSTTTRTISFTVNDGDDDSNTPTRNVSVTAENDAPVLTEPSSATVSFTEGGGAVQITSTISIADADDINLTSATVEISGGYQSGEDQLSYTSYGSITGSFSSGTLTLSGSESLANYQSVLQSVTFNNTSDNPSTTTRTISFTVNDGDDDSNTPTRNVSITAENDAPVLIEPSSAIVSFTEGGGAVQITSTISITDADDINLTSAAVEISSGYQSGEDELAYTSYGGISGSFSSGILSLSGSASIANYQSVLQSVTFNNTSDNPSTTTRTISFTVNDGDDDSNTPTRNVSVTAENDAPVLTEPSSATVSFTEGGGAVQITSTISITDADDINLTSATVEISSGYQSGEDELAYTSYGGVTGSFSSGILSLSGSASLTDYQNVLRNVTFNNTSDDPSTTTRTISFTVNDGDDDSNTPTRNVSVTEVNDAPTATEVDFAPITSIIGTTVTATFTYSDPEGDGEGTHEYQWYRATNATGSGKTAIPGATSETYKIVIADGSKWLGVEVTPKDDRGGTGDPVQSTTFRYINAAPVASSVHIYAPDPTPGHTISGRFSYSDLENNTQGNAIYTWYRKNTSPTIESPGNVVQGPSTDSTFLLTSAESNKYIWFKVKPVANSGSTPGDSVWCTPLLVGSFSASITGSNSYCEGTTMPIELTISGGLPDYTIELSRSGSTLNMTDSTITVSSSPYTIQVNIPGTYTLTSVTDDLSNSANITASTVILSYYETPKATISGTAQICNDGVSTATLTVDFVTGTAPYTFTIRRRENPSFDTTFTDISTDPFTFEAQVLSSANTRHRVYAITDANGCPGDTASGSAWVSYKASPTADLSGGGTICPGDTIYLDIELEGTAPWNITYLRNGINPITITGIEDQDYQLMITQAGTYTLSYVSDLICTGKVFGSAVVDEYTLPTATISGGDNICEHTTTPLTITLTGASPWKFSYQRNLNDTTEIVNVTESPNFVFVGKEGTYSLVDVFDSHCEGTVSGSASVTVKPAPEVTINGLNSTYNVATNYVPFTVSPTDAEEYPNVDYVFYSGSWYFSPNFAEIGTHNVIFRDLGTNECYGYDTVVVRVLEAEAEIEFEGGRTKFCDNEGPFLVTGSNVAEDIGEFTIEGGVGLVDFGDNTAMVYPSLLSNDNYEITYTYEDGGVPFDVVKEFELGVQPVADFQWATECFHTGQSIDFSSTSVSNFGNLTDTSYYWKVYTSTGYEEYDSSNVSHTFAQEGNHNIEMWIINSYGCSDTVEKIFPLRPTIELAGITYFENFETSPISWRKGNSSGTTTNSWLLGDPSSGFSGASSGTKCWYTNITSSPAPTEQSWVTSPCFDFTGAERPMVKMDIWRLFNTNRDGANLQVTVDSGKTWSNVGQIGDGIKWYNSYSIQGFPGSSSVGWSNSTGTGNDAYWVEARHSLDILKEKNNVQFRIAYGSANSAQNNHGIAFDDIWIVERNRMALIEHFTNSSDADSKDANEALNNLVNDNLLNMVDLQYHTSNPAGDPFYADNPAIPGARQFFYGLYNVPNAIVNGGTESDLQINFGDPLLEEDEINAITIEYLKDSPFWINLNSNVKGNTLTVEAEVNALTVLPYTELTVQLAVIERVITGITGVNGETQFESVVKTLLPNAAGNAINKSWIADESSFVTQNWDLQNVYDPTELRVVAFIQNTGTKEVYQVAIDTIGVFDGINELPGTRGEKAFIVYPNPVQQKAFIKFTETPLTSSRLQLYNNLGSLIKEKEVPAGTEVAEISVEGLPKGMYILRMMNDKGLSGTRKLIISD